MAAPPKQPGFFLTPKQQKANAAKAAKTAKAKTSARTRAANGGNRPGLAVGTPQTPTAPTRSGGKPKPLVVPSATDTLTSGLSTKKKQPPKPPAPKPTKKSTPVATPTPAPSGGTKAPASVPATHVVVQTHVRAKPTPKVFKGNANANAALTGGGTPQLVSENGRNLLPKKTSTKTTVKVQQSGGGGAGGAGGTSTTAGSSASDPVTEQVDAAQLPALQAIDKARAASELAAKTNATTTTGYYTGLADILQGAAPAVQGAYQSAAADTSAFGKGFSDGLAHVQSQNDASATNAAGISGGAAPAPGGPAASNALYALGGYIPATGLEREGAGFAAAAAHYPSTAAGQGASALSGIQAQQRQDQTGFAKDYSDLAAQAPGLRLQYQAQADAKAATAAAAAQKAAQVRRAQAIQYILATGIGPDGKLTPKARAELASAMGYDPTTGKPTARTVDAQGRLKVAQVNAQTAIDHLSLAQQKAFSDMYGHDANGNLTLPGQRAALAQWKADHAGKKGGYTKAKLYQISKDAAKDADLYRHGKLVNDSSGNPDPSKSVNSEPDYQVALKQMLAAGIPMSIAQRALNVYWPLGNAGKGRTDSDGAPLPYGRPYLSVQERMVLDKVGGVNDPFSPPTPQQVAYLHAHGFNYTGPVAALGPSKNG